MGFLRGYLTTHRPKGLPWAQLESLSSRDYWRIGISDRPGDFIQVTLRYFCLGTSSHPADSSHKRILWLLALRRCQVAITGDADTQGLWPRTGCATPERERANQFPFYARPLTTAAPVPAELATIWVKPTMRYELLFRLRGFLLSFTEVCNGELYKERSMNYPLSKRT